MGQLKTVESQSAVLPNDCYAAVAVCRSRHRYSRFLSPSSHSMSRCRVYLNDRFRRYCGPTLPAARSHHEGPLAEVAK